MTSDEAAAMYRHIYDDAYDLPAAVSSRNLPMVVSFTVPGNPTPKARPRLAPRGNTYTPARTVDAEGRIRQYLFVTYPHLRPMTGRMSLFVELYLKGAQRGDWDNYGKLISDALNKRVWHDDKQVIHACVSVHSDEANPRTEIMVYVLESI